MSDFEILINNKRQKVRTGNSVAAALLQSGNTTFRLSVTGQPRSPLCGMGTCYECRVTINGRSQIRSCQILCQPGMNVITS